MNKTLLILWGFFAAGVVSYALVVHTSNWLGFVGGVITGCAMLMFSEGKWSLK